MRFCIGLVFVLNIMLSSASAQTYPKGYFRYPLDIPPKLNANFGEMRPNHFHMGLDLFTNKRENLPVYAAADGYVSKVKIEPGGFGHALYITHPNGFTTLYAHMNAFLPEVEAWIKGEQYRRESWSVEMDAPPGKFPVKKGQVVGKSGNTGASQGPHVHFEVRDSRSGKCLNPLLFGFPIPDDVAPDIGRLAVYDRNKSMYGQHPRIVPIRKSGSGYSAGLVRVETDKLTLALQATDHTGKVPNANGIFSVVAEDNGRPAGGFRLDRIGYEDTRYLNAHIDYMHKLGGGGYLQGLFPLPGDKLDIYDRRAPGYMVLKDTLRHEVRLTVRDAYGNSSVLNFQVQRIAGPKTNVPVTGDMMRPGELNVEESDGLQVYIPEGCLYDSVVYIPRSRPEAGPLSFSPIHSVLSYLIPSHKSFSVRIRPDKPVPVAFKDHMLMRRKGKADDIDVMHAALQSGYYAADFREFGDYQLIADDKPPVILMGGLHEGANMSRAPKIVVMVMDDNHAVGNFRAELDGKWLLFARKSNTFAYDMDEHCPPGHHTLHIRVSDEAGNLAEKTVNFTR